MNLFNKTGKMAIGSRLRLFSAKVNDEAAKIYQLYDIDLIPKWFPVFFVLSDGEEKTITDIACEIGHSQPSVSKIIREMTAKGLVVENIKSVDKRRNVVTLSPKGRNFVAKIKTQYADVERTIENVIKEARNNLWEALEEWEYLLEQKSLFRRVQELKKIRESKDVRIVAYEDKYQNAFKTLNEEWISTYFEMEETDYKVLDNPQEYILDNGGEIFVALYNDEPVGVCSLIRMDDEEYDFELAKMAVSPKAQGKSIGWLLGQMVVERARELGGSKLYLESNTVLKPAINLYQKLGFRKIVGRTTPYKRCNIQMELDLNPSKSDD